MSTIAMQKGDKAILLGFTGIRLAEVEISKATKKELTVVKKDGKEMVFDRNTGIQTNVEEGKEKYANKLVHPTDDAAQPKPKKEKAKKAPKKVEEPEEIEEEEVEEEEEEVEEKPKKAKKAPAKKGSRKKKAEVVEIEEDDDEEYEEL